MTVEWPETTADQLRALRELRFVTTNQARDRVWGYDYDVARCSAVGGHVTRFERAPGVWDCQVQDSRPRIIAEVERMLGLASG